MSTSTLPIVRCTVVLLAALACSASGFSAVGQEEHSVLWRFRRHNRPPAECDPYGDKDAGHPKKPHRKKPGDINRGDCPPRRYQWNDWDRSGRADLVSHWAKTSTQRSFAGKYAGGYVGGGAALKGRCRTTDEGTWGLDYQFFDHINVFMKWTSCGRRQGGEGAYASDHEKLGR